MLHNVTCSFMPSGPMQRLAIRFISDWSNTDGMNREQDRKWPSFALHSPQKTPVKARLTRSIPAGSSSALSASTSDRSSSNNPICSNSSFIDLLILSSSYQLSFCPQVLSLLLYWSVVVRHCSYHLAELS